jgi:hypothetical protein
MLSGCSGGRAYTNDPVWMKSSFGGQFDQLIGRGAVASVCQAPQVAQIGLRMSHDLHWFGP